MPALGSQDRERRHRAGHVARSGLEAFRKYLARWMRRALHSRLSGVLLAGKLTCRSQTCAIPHSGERRCVHTDKPHTWHMATIGTLPADPEVLLATPFHVVDLDDEQSSADAVAGDGIDSRAAKHGGQPLNFIRRAPGVTQPAIKCRVEYLRIIYGPNISCPELERLRARTLERSVLASRNSPWSRSWSVCPQGTVATYSRVRLRVLALESSHRSEALVAVVYAEETIIPCWDRARQLVIASVLSSTIAKRQTGLET